MRIQPTTNIRVLIAEHPAVTGALERFGLMGCGGPAGPDEPLDFFARVHHVPLDELMRAIEEAIGAAAPGSRPADAAAPPAAETAERFRTFLLASLFLTLTAGATLGMLNLARLTSTWGSLPRPSVWAHAYAQVFGFVGLFVMGVAYHVVPRFVGVPLQLPRVCSASFWLTFGGVCAVTTALLAGRDPIGWLWSAGGVALLAGTVLFAASVSRTLAATPSPRQPFEPWLLFGCLWLVAGAALGLVASFAGDIWQQLLWPAALYGFAGSWIFGVGRRIFPVFLGWDTRWPRVDRPVLLLYQAGVVGWTAGAWPEQTPMLQVARGAGAAALILAVVGYSGIIGALRLPATLHGRAEGMPPSGGHQDIDRGYQRFVTAAWIWLFVGLATGPLWTIGAVVRGGYGSVTMLDFARHAVAFGFVTQMMMGIASRILPVFTGHPLWSARVRTASFWLLNAAVLIRSLEAIVAAGWLPQAWPYIAWSGPLGVAAVGLFGSNVILTIWPPASPLAAAHQPRPAAADPAEATVHDLIQIPGVLEALVGAGFTPLENPVMRATFARTVTLQQACRLKGIELAAVLGKIGPLLRAASGNGRTAGASTSPRPIPLRIVRDGVPGNRR